MFGWPGRAYVISDLHLATICIYYQYWQEKETAKYPFFKNLWRSNNNNKFYQKRKKKKFRRNFYYNWLKWYIVS